MLFHCVLCLMQTFSWVDSIQGWCLYFFTDKIVHWSFFVCNSGCILFVLMLQMIAYGWYFKKIVTYCKPNILCILILKIFPLWIIFRVMENSCFHHFINITFPHANMDGFFVKSSWRLKCKRVLSHLFGYWADNLK